MFDDGILDAVRTLSEIGYKAFCVRLPIANITVWQLAVALVLFCSIIYVYERITSTEQKGKRDNNNYRIYRFERNMK